MSYRSIINPPGPVEKYPERNTPPFNIPGVILPHWEVHDNFIDEKFHHEVYDYLMDCHWTQHWHPLPREFQIYRPNDWDDGWVGAGSIQRKLSQPRALFAVDEPSLEERHPIIWELWKRINAQLGNCYAITGSAEGMPITDSVFQGDPNPVHPSLLPRPLTADPSLPNEGWRVYANATPHDLINLGGYIHRDTPDLSDETSVTILWIASKEWYPSWGSTLSLFPEDPEGLTGDHQQFNTGAGQQHRNFQIGWQDEGKTISMRPGRLILYDGRTLHTTEPSKHRYNVFPNRRVVFRARRIK